jgi:AcrR family transcriptional regulator
MRDSAHTKKRIVDAAEKVFSRKGLAGARIQEIAERRL